MPENSFAIFSHFSLISLQSAGPRGSQSELVKKIENSIKLARIYTGRHKIITHYRSYHGATYAALAASGGDPRGHVIDTQGLPNFIHVENPYAYRCPWGTDSPEECGE